MCKLLLVEVGGSDRTKQGRKASLKIDMLDDYISAIPFSIPDPERRCLFHFTASIESGSSFFSHCQKKT